MSDRVLKLKRNNVVLFWAHSFLNIKITNSVLSLFYAARGLSDAEIVWVALFWAIGTLVFEIPSSYMADRWGRKNTLLVGAFFGILQWVILVYADGFSHVALAMLCYGIWSACFSGTDIALIYDTKRELGEEQDSLRALGSYKSARNLFKIASALLGVYIAQGLTNNQFLVLLSIDIIASILALCTLLFITEPNHYMDLEEQEAGVFKDAVKLIRREPLMQRAILNRVIIFLAGFAVWTYYQKMYVELGVPILWVGIGWSIYHLLSFLGIRRVHVIARLVGLTRAINTSVVWYTLLVAVVVLLYSVGAPGGVIFGAWVCSALLISLRMPLFDEYFNTFSHSYNRATTLSLTNIVHNVLEFPILFLAGSLVAIDLIYPYIFVVILGILVIFMLPVRAST